MANLDAASTLIFSLKSISYIQMASDEQVTTYAIWPVPFLLEATTIYFMFVCKNKLTSRNWLHAEAGSAALCP
jgi:hypothetical protein